MVWWRSALVVVLLVGALALLFLYTGLPPEPDRKSISGRLLKSGIYSVGAIDYRLIDTERVTAANGDFAGLRHRELDTRVWYPEVEDGEVAPGRHPLVVYSHGYSSSKIGGAYLADYLARQGYIVVAADFPLTRAGAPGGPTLKDLAHQPGDVSFLIDTLLAWNGDPDSPLYERIDAERIAAMGISLGGLTSTLVAYHPRWRDPRVSVAISIAGPSSMLEAAFFRDAEAPFLMIGGSEDVIVSYADNAAPIPDKLPGATLVSIEGASHTGFSGMARYLRWLDNPDGPVCNFVSRQLDRQPLQEGWYALVGTQEEGVIPNGDLPRCPAQLPVVINPVVQQWITTLAVFNFLQQYFALTGVEIAAAQNYLYQVLPREFTEVTVSGFDNG